MQQSIKDFLDLLKIKRRPGESMARWTSCFQLTVTKTGKALHEAQAEFLLADARLAGVPERRQRGSIPILC